MKLKIYTLVFVKKRNEILLGLKARGFGVGLWNGFGGKVEKGENIFEGAKRELKEESNLQAENLNHLGVVTYEEENNPIRSIVHVFITYNVIGTVRGSEEMNPVKWFKFRDIPYQDMWPDANLWYPYVLQDQYFLALVKYGIEDKITEKRVLACCKDDVCNSAKWGCCYNNHRSWYHAHYALYLNLHQNKRLCTFGL